MTNLWNEFSLNSIWNDDFVSRMIWTGFLSSRIHECPIFSVWMSDQIWYYSIIPKVKLMSPSLNQKVKWQEYSILCPANTDPKRIAGNVSLSWIFNYCFWNMNYISRYIRPGYRTKLWIQPFEMAHISSKCQ